MDDPSGSLSSTARIHSQRRNTATMRTSALKGSWAMEHAITERLTGVFRSIFNNREIQIARSTTADDIRGWDSLMHINLIVAVEKEFRVRFTTLEVMSMNNVGDLLDTISAKC